MQVPCGMRQLLDQLVLAPAQEQLPAGCIHLAQMTTMRAQGAGSTHAKERAVCGRTPRSLA